MQERHRLGSFALADPQGRQLPSGRPWALDAYLSGSANKRRNPVLGAGR
jgi:hypothetical protein